MLIGIVHIRLSLLSLVAFKHEPYHYIMSVHGGEMIADEFSQLCSVGSISFQSSLSVWSF